VNKIASSRKKIGVKLFIYVSFLLFLLSTIILTKKPVANAAISTPLSFVTKKTMDFKEIVTGTTTSSFRIDINGDIVKLSGDGIIFSGKTSEGSVRINGKRKEVVNYTISPISNLTGAGTPILVSSYTTNSPINTNSNANIGATITLAPNQASGSYSGSYVINAEYQNDPGVVYTSPAQNIYLRVLAQPTVTETTQMSFGKFLPDISGGTVTLSKTGNISNTSGTATFLGGHQLGIFGITGEPGTNVNISFSSGNVLTGTGVDIALTGLNTSNTSPSLGGSGSTNISVYGGITYSAGQAPGVYQGSYVVFVNY